MVVAADIDWMNTIDWSPAGNVIPDPYTPSLTGTPYPYLTASFWGGNVVEAGEEKDGVITSFIRRSLFKSRICRICRCCLLSLRITLCPVNQ